MNDAIIKTNKSVFEDIKHVENGQEFWYARELGEVLDYAKWENFSKVVEKAKTSIYKTGEPVENHFLDVRKMVSIGYATQKNPRPITDVKLTRYACYIIAQNGDSAKKPKIAEAQAYFATQTRKQELSEQYRNDMARLARRQEFSESDKRISAAIVETGIGSRGLAEIKSSGDAAFFGGKSNKQMKKILGTGSKPWANKAHNVVLAGKTLANEMTTANIENFGVSSFDGVKNDNIDNNQAVRKTITEQQGLEPENFPASEDTDKIKARIKLGTNNLLQK